MCKLCTTGYHKRRRLQFSNKYEGFVHCQISKLTILQVVQNDTCLNRSTNRYSIFPEVIRINSEVTPYLDYCQAIMAVDHYDIGWPSWSTTVVDHDGRPQWFPSSSRKKYFFSVNIRIVLMYPLSNCTYVSPLLQFEKLFLQ